MPEGRVLMARAKLVHLPTWTKNGTVRVVVESPKGSAVKFDYDPDLDVFMYGKALPLGLTYPYCWGFLPGTRGDDGDPLDVFVLDDAPTFPGVVIDCRLVGVLRLEEKGKKGRERNDRLIAVPVADPKVADGCEDVADLPERLREEMEQFFLSTTFFTHKHATVQGWKGHKGAAKLVRRSQTT
jgi:inorganic pyrophosphatase